MDQFTINPNAKVSSVTASEFSFSFAPNAKLAYEPSMPSMPLPLASYKITNLPKGRLLTHPLEVRIAYDDGEVIVSEPHFHIHAAGTTLTEALAEFKLTLIEELDELTTDEHELGPRLQAELRYLRGLIRTA